MTGLSPSAQWMESQSEARVNGNESCSSCNHPAGPTLTSWGGAEGGLVSKALYSLLPERTCSWLGHVVDLFCLKVVNDDV